MKDPRTSRRAVPAAWAAGVLLAAASFAGLPGDLAAQTQDRPQSVRKVKDFVQVDGAAPMKLRGYGVVTGINGQGDSPGGEAERMIRNFLTNLTGQPITRFNIKNVAAVTVTATLDPFQKGGTSIDIRVSTTFDAKSISGGTLLMTPLRSIVPRTHPSKKGEAIYAIAQGRVIVEGDERSGNHTTGSIPGGALVTKALQRNIVKNSGSGGDAYLTLNLRRPDLNLASMIVNELNTVLFSYPDPEDPEGQAMRSLPVARTVDAGSINVFIPTKDVWERTMGSAYPGFDEEPVLFLNRVFNVNIPVTSIARRPVVTINDTTKAIAWTAEVVVRPGRVRVGDLFVGSESRESTLSAILTDAGNAATSQDLVNIVRALADAGLLEAEVRSR